MFKRYKSAFISCCEEMNEDIDIRKWPPPFQVFTYNDPLFWGMDEKIRETQGDETIESRAWWLAGTRDTDSVEDWAACIKHKLLCTLTSDDVVACHITDLCGWSMATMHIRWPIRNNSGPLRPLTALIPPHFISPQIFFKPLPYVTAAQPYNAHRHKCFYGQVIPIS